MPELPRPSTVEEAIDLAGAAARYKMALEIIATERLTTNEAGHVAKLALTNAGPRGLK